MKLGDLRKDTQKNKSKFTNWRKEGKFVFWVHPGSEIGKRTRIRFRIPMRGDDGEWYFRNVWRTFQEEKDPTAQLLSWLRDNDEIDLDEVVLRVKSGTEVEEYNKGELLGLEEYGWKKQLLRPKTEYLFSVVNNGEPKETEVLTLPFSAGKKFVRLVDSQIDEYGDDEGNPWENPYPFKVTFDPDASGTDMYNVERHLAKLGKEVQDIFENSEPDNVEALCDPDNDNNDGMGTSEELLAQMLVIPVPFLEVDIEREAVPPPASSEPKEKPAAKKSKPVEDDTPAGMVKAKDCQKGETYVNADGEKLKFKKVLDSGKCKFLDEDGDVVKLKGDELLSAGAVGAAEPEPSDDGKVLVKDITEKGTELWNSDGEKLTFVRYSEAKEKGFFDDEDGDRAAMAGTEVLFTNAPEGGAEDPLAPIGQEEDLMLCPNCDAEVPVSATSCPKCKAKFEVDADQPFT